MSENKSIDTSNVETAPAASNPQASDEKRPRDEYDPPWKEMIVTYFADFLAFFFWTCSGSSTG